MAQKDKGRFKMYQKVKKYLTEHEMIKTGDVILAGVSGGGDSMAMLGMLRNYQQEFSFLLCVVHVHHGIRGEEANRDEQLVKDICEKWNLPFFSYHYPVPQIAKEQKIGLEEAGRMVRQEAFERAKKDFLIRLQTLQEKKEQEEESSSEVPRMRIALAHNANDVAETLLHNLCRGTGMKGMASIQPVRGTIIRPVLCLKKEEILGYLKEEKIPYVTDSTNLTDDYTRNKIRHKILPLLEEINPAAVRHMTENAELAEQTAAYLERQGEKLVLQYGKELEDGFFLSEEFWEEESVLLPYGILHLFEKTAGKRKDFTAAHVKSVCDLSRLQVGRKICLPYGLEAKRTYGGILFEKTKKTGKQEEKFHGESPADPACRRLLVPGETVWKDHIFSAKIIFNESQKIEEKKYTKWLDYDRIKQELSVRTRLQGDFLVVDEKGSRKKLNRYFIDEKIPSRERDSIPLLALGSEILWVVGGRINEAYKITPRTRRILEIQYQGGKDNHE